MKLLGNLVFRRDRSVVVVECRRCGTTVDRGTSVCPACEAAEIATYRIR